MCMELNYENSHSKGLVDIAYLAIGDKMIVNKTFIDEDNGYEELKNFSHFDAELYIRYDSEDGNSKPMTMLLTYDDIDNWDLSFQKQLTDMSNMDLNEELYECIFEMMLDAMTNCGFHDTCVSDLIFEAIETNPTFFQRTTDFMMHQPTNDDLHPWYDT